MTHLRLAAVLAAMTLPLARARGGDVWHVSSVWQLINAVSSAGSGDEIIIAAGDYHMTRPLEVWANGLTIRGATGDRDDVHLVGSGMNVSGTNEGICFSADNVTVRDLTLRDFYHNALHIRGERDADGTVISNVKTWNIGQRHVKGSGGGVPGAVSDDVIIENLYMLQTEARADGNHHGDYIGGIDCMGVRNWIIRDCVAEGIRGHYDGGNAAIFLWQGVEGVTVERNRIISCVKGIALGNPAAPSVGIFTYPWHATDALIRNNTVLRGPWTTGNNIGLELCNTSDIEAYNNTFYSEYAGYFRQVSLLDDNGGGAISNVEIVNNIIRGHVWDHAAGTWTDQTVRDMGNIVDATGGVVTPAWFADAAGGDFHLTDQALAAIDGAEVLAAVPEDIDRILRLGVPDLGADEFRIPGDATGDNVVDYLDLGVLAVHYDTSSGAWHEGDFNRDGVVDYEDLGILSVSYGTALGGARGGEARPAVPEPACLVLLLVGGTAARLGSRRR